MRLSAYRFALPVLVATLLVPAAAEALPRGAVHLERGAYKRVGADIRCGLVDGRWRAGTLRRSYWFVSHAQAARNANRGAAARRWRRRARIEHAACQPLRFDLRGAVGAAVHGGARPRAGDLSNLDVMRRNGRVRDAITAGTATVRRIFEAPDGTLYALFAYRIPIGGGEPIGEPICDEEDLEDEEDFEDEEGSEERGVDDDEGDEDCYQETTPIEYCLLAKLDPATREPLCVEADMMSIREGTFRGANESVQFDAAGAVYYMGQGHGGSGFVLRRALHGEKRDYVVDADVVVDDYLVLADGDVLVSGATRPTGARWLRRIEPSGRTHSLWSVSATFLRLFPDGHAYLGAVAGEQTGVWRLGADDVLDPDPWIDHDRAAITCAEADRPAREAFCRFAGGHVSDMVTTPDGRVFAIAGPSDGGRLVQYFPEVRLTPTNVRKVAVGELVGDDVALAGVDEHDRRVLVLHDTATETERVIIGPDAEVDVYHLAYDAETGKLRFDGLRFADNRYVLGEVDLATGAVTFVEDSPTRWRDLV